MQTPKRIPYIETSLQITRSINSCLSNLNIVSLKFRLFYLPFYFIVFHFHLDFTLLFRFHHFSITDLYTFIQCESISTFEQFAKFKNPVQQIYSIIMQNCRFIFEESWNGWDNICRIIIFFNTEQWNHSKQAPWKGEKVERKVSFIHLWVKTVSNTNSKTRYIRVLSTVLITTNSVRSWI